MDWYANTLADSTVNGYSNHYWNGITTLAWCEICHGLIENSINLKLVQAGTDKIYSKYEMLNLFSLYLPNRSKIDKYSDLNIIDRSLIPNFIVEDLEIQLKKYFKITEI